MRNEKWKIRIAKSGYGLVCICIVCLFLAPQVSAQTAKEEGGTDPLHQLNNSVRALVKRVTPSVVQVLAQRQINVCFDRNRLSRQRISES